MILTLFKMTLKKNWRLLLIFIVILAIYCITIISIFDPNDMAEFEAMMNMFPESLMSAMGFSGAATELTSYMASWLYGLLMIAFPMIYSIILGNRLVAKLVDNGSFAYLLSTPNSRVKIIMTQGIYALFSVAVLGLSMFGLGAVISHIMFPGLLEVGAFFSLNLTTTLVNMLTLMISFFFSCVFNETKYSLGFGGGIPLVFLLMNMLSGASKKLKIIKSFTIYGFYDPVEVAQGGDVVGINLFYIGATIILLLLGVTIFKKKRLPL